MAALALVCGLFLVPSARADGDPASDALYTQNVFLPYSTKVAPALAEELLQATAAAKSAGTPVRVALIAAPADLGSIPSLYGRPEAYARFLGAELQFVYPGRLIVVMPQGAALSTRGRLVPNASVEHAKIQRGGDGLARAALTLVRNLAGTSPRPLPSSPTSGAPSGSSVTPSASGPVTASRGVPLWEGAAIAAGIVAVILLSGLAFVRRRWRTNRLQPIQAVTRRPPNPNDPYRYRDRL
jgi:hypothetical protein